MKARPRCYRASCWLALGLSLTGGCLNPRPEDFPSVVVADDDAVVIAPGITPLPGAGPTSGDFLNEAEPPPSVPPSAAPSVPTENGSDVDAGAPGTDGGFVATAAAAAAAADAGAVQGDSPDGCDAP